MAQKRKTDQTKLDALAALLSKIELKTASSVKSHLGDNWRENLFEIMMTRIDLAAPHKKTFAELPSVFRKEPKALPKFAKIFWRTMKGMLKLAHAPARPHHVAAFGVLYLSVVDAFFKDSTKDHSKTMSVLDQRLGLFEEFTDYTRCRK